uniref:SapC family protein n=1 Tax=Ningiella ruwaisensis TaxID=2364274 RepID=UPI00109FB560|nr:SapC family protein [Ningiella ruwaisensis]
MANHKILNNIEHKDLKVMTHCSAQFGHNVGAIHIFANEITRAQCEYPILFLKNEKDGNFQCLAILGLHHEENLFLDEKQGWRASYVPNIVKKGPFSIGFQNQNSDGNEEQKAVILIDVDDPRVNNTRGQSVFMEFGGNTPYLESIQNILAELDKGAKLSAPMFAAFNDLDLLEPCVFDIKINDENMVKFEGYHTINVERLSQLEGKDLEFLNKSGLLSIAFAAATSINNIDKLVKLKRLQLSTRANAKANA